MKSKRPETKAHAPSLNNALSSPMRLEVVGLFAEPGPLSIADMATRLGRPATSLYHHVQVLEAAGVLRRAGTRPKGKRFETTFELCQNRMELEVDDADEEALRQAGQTMSAALRMAERDFIAALDRDDINTEGDRRNLIGLRTHMCLSPAALARLGKLLRGIEEFLQAQAAESVKRGPNDQFLSLTFLLAPLRGRRSGGASDSTSDNGDPS